MNGKQTDWSKLDTFLRRKLSLRFSAATLSWLHSEAMRLDVAGLPRAHNSSYDAVSRRLQALKRNGEAVYLPRSKGGPGWVRK